MTGVLAVEADERGLVGVRFVDPIDNRAVEPAHLFQMFQSRRGAFFQLLAKLVGHRWLTVDVEWNVEDEAVETEFVEVAFAGAVVLGEIEHAVFFGDVVIAKRI